MSLFPCFTPEGFTDTRGNQHTGSKEMSETPRKSFLTGEEVKPGSEMSRGTQTWLLLTGLALATFLVIGFSKSGEDPNYPHCDIGFMGAKDYECRSMSPAKWYRQKYGD